MAALYRFTGCIAAAWVRRSPADECVTNDLVVRRDIWRVVAHTDHREVGGKAVMEHLVRSRRSLKTELTLTLASFAVLVFFSLALGILISGDGRALVIALVVVTIVAIVTISAMHGCVVRSIETSDSSDACIGP